MIPEHLKHLKFDPDGFFQMKNGRWGINDDQITRLAGQVGVEEQTATIEHMNTTDRKTICSARVRLVIKGKKWEAVASVTSSEFSSDKFEDRRKYHLAQMAATRARNNALSTAIGLTNDDVDEIANHLGVIPDKHKKHRNQDNGPEPDVPDEPEESEEEQKKKQEEMRKRMKAIKERSG